MSAAAGTSAALFFAPVSQVVSWSELDYWEDLPLGPMGARVGWNNNSQQTDK